MKYKVTLKKSFDGINAAEMIVADGFYYEEGCFIFWKKVPAKAWWRWSDVDLVKLYSISNVVSVEIV